MARPIWNGTVSFGLLNIPVQLYSGERSMDLPGTRATHARRKSAVDGNAKRSRPARRKVS